MPCMHVRTTMRAGAALFQLLGGSVADSSLQTGFAFAAIQYATKYVRVWALRNQTQRGGCRGVRN